MPGSTGGRVGVGASEADGVVDALGSTPPAGWLGVGRAPPATPPAAAMRPPPANRPTSSPVDTKRLARLSGTPIASRVLHPGQRPAPVANGRLQTGQEKMLRSGSPMGIEDANGSGGRMEPKSALIATVGSDGARVGSASWAAGAAAVRRRVVVARGVVDARAVVARAIGAVCSTGGRSGRETMVPCWGVPAGLRPGLDNPCETQYHPAA